MKKALGIFLLSAMSLIGCGESDNHNKQVITLSDQDAIKNKPEKIKPSIVPCNIEVRMDDEAIKTTAATMKKFYNFCDSTVVITGVYSGQGGPALSIRQIKDLQGREKQEAREAGAKYQALIMNN